MTAPAEQAPAAEAATWRSNLAFADKLLGEALYEYTSKDRLRRIAIIGLATLRAMYENAATIAEQQAPERDALIVPSTEMPK